jgi:acetyl-CoA carboxylase carboxyl transferase subunit alpha
LENAIYSVISPEGCASILWRDPKKMLDAAKAMKLSSKDLLNLKVIDEIISEPVGGAHRDRDLILDNVRKSIENNLNEFFNMSGDEIFNHRKNKFLTIGRNKGFISNLDDLSTLSMKKNRINTFIESFFKSKVNLIASTAVIILLSYLIFFLYSATTVFKFFACRFTFFISGNF